MATPPKSNSKPAAVPKGAGTPDHINKWQRFRVWVKNHKRLSLGFGAGLLIAASLFWPPIRYEALNTVTAAQASVRVVDGKSGQPVYKAQVELAGKSGETDEEGNLVLEDLDFGKTGLRVSKSAYKEYDASITVAWPHNTLAEVNLEATGTPVAIRVINRINSQPVAGVEVAADIKGTSETVKAASNSEGLLTLVVPPTDSTDITVTLNAEGWLKASSSVALGTTKTETQTLRVVPAGKVYFLSKRTGKINVMKSNLDGSNAEVVLAGTGKENDSDTSLLVSRDWRYLALKARRQGEYSALHLIETGTDRLREIDSGKASFSPRGWYDHHFIYTVSVDGGEGVSSQKLKSYNAETGQITLLDTTVKQGKARSYLGAAYILENEVVYTKTWENEDYNLEDAVVLKGKQDMLISVRPDGTAKTTVKTFNSANYNYIDIRPYKPQELYVSVDGGESDTVYYEYAAGKLTENKEIGEGFYRSYNNYLISPNGRRSFWSESRDGKGTFFIGDKTGAGAKNIGALREYTAYGWFSDDYLLISKDASTLFIVATSGLKGQAPLKITDYHKPDYRYGGYGYGYGGL